MITIDREAFAAALSRIGPSGTTEIAFSDGSWIAKTSHHMVSGYGDGETLSVFVNGALLAGIVRELPGPILTIDATARRLRIMCGGTKTTLPLQPPPVCRLNTELPAAVATTDGDRLKWATGAVLPAIDPGFLATFEASDGTLNLRGTNNYVYFSTDLGPARGTGSVVIGVEDVKRLRSLLLPDRYEIGIDNGLVVWNERELHRFPRAHEVPAPRLPNRDAVATWRGPNVRSYMRAASAVATIELGSTSLLRYGGPGFRSTIDIGGEATGTASADLGAYALYDALRWLADTVEIAITDRFVALSDERGFYAISRIKVPS